VIIYTLQLSSNFSYSFRALSFSLGSFPIYTKALWHTLLRRKNGFVVTSKKRLTGSYRHLVAPHLLFILLVIAGVVVGVMREGWSGALLSNLAWTTIYIIVFLPFIQAAFERQSQEKPAPLSRKAHA
jgi:cellulose synthase (UDP-forming)